MAFKLECAQCGRDLEGWNCVPYTETRYCPYCGKKITEEARAELYRKTTDAEMSDMIKDHVLDLLSCAENEDGTYDSSMLRPDELAERAWEAENIDGVVFYSNYAADLFVRRHEEWVGTAVDYLEDMVGDGSYSKMRCECVDRFLVAAFIAATEHYLYGQIGIDRNGGEMTDGQVDALKERMNATDYDGGF
jgi:hypothetical protein